MKKIIIIFIAIAFLLVSCSTPTTSTPTSTTGTTVSTNSGTEGGNNGGNTSTPSNPTTTPATTPTNGGSTNGTTSGSDNGNNGGNTSTPSNPTNPTTQYTVTFNSNGGSSVVSQTVSSNGHATRPSNPTKEGYVFDYWYSTNENSEYDFATATITDNITLHAKWGCTYIIVDNNEYNTVGNNLSSTSLTFKMKCIDTAEIQTVTHITTTSMYTGFTSNTYNGNIHFAYTINNNKITFSLSNYNNPNVLNQFELYNVSRNENIVTVEFRNKR